MSLAAKQRQLIDDLLLIENSQERLAVIVDRARTHPPLPAAERNDSHRVRGCISHAWIIGELREGRCHFRSDADSPLVRGLIVLLCDLYSDASPADIASTEPQFLEELGLTRMISPTRLNGLRSVRARIAEIARAASAPSA